MSIAALVRPEVRDLCAYRTTDSSASGINLHANEAPVATGTGLRDGLNRYPARRPAALTLRMANHYGVDADNVLVTRGSTEGIDLLLRTFCSAGRDSVLLTPPTFGMYQVYASVQGARSILVPLQAEREFALDTSALLRACEENTKLIFLCTPNNPAGGVIPAQQILRILCERAAQSLVVVDEAYIEYSGTESLAPLVREYENLVVLRTMSKALALAGVRCGALIASDTLVKLIDGVLAPYALSSPAIASAELALSDRQLSEARKSIDMIIAERERMQLELGGCKAVQQVWPSQANFLFLRFHNLHSIRSRLNDENINIRIYNDDPLLKNCARITVALAADNDSLIGAVRSAN
jgi:histidinol-phosphate aminotransferase